MAPPEPRAAGRRAWPPLLLPLALGLAPYLGLVARFDWLCDDAFISFTYAKRLAEGHGLVFNVGERVEGYTNFLWVVWLAVFERLGWDTTFWARASSIACGVALLVATVRYARLRLGAGTAAASLTAVFLGTLPPLAVWSTGGLATMPFALGIFLAWERLLGCPLRPRGPSAGALLALVTLIRADGAAFAAAVLGTAAATAWLRRDARLGRALAVAGACAALAVGGYVAWRWSYYGELVPNTAYVKVGIGPTSLKMGAQYAASFLLVFPSVTLVLAAALGLAGRPRGGPALQAWAMVLATFGYAVLVGGDFMTMGRFLVPALPFVGVLFAALATRFLGAGPVAPPRLAAGAALTAALAVLSLLPAWNAHAVPRAWREACKFRWGTPRFVSELESWARMREHWLEWSRIGRALALHTEPGECLTATGIGCFGYYSGLRIVDLLGLVNPELAKDPRHRRDDQSAGHGVYPSPEYLAALDCKYAGAHVYAAGELRPLGPAQAAAFVAHDHPLRAEDGFEPGSVLRILEKKRPTEE